MKNKSCSKPRPTLRRNNAFLVAPILAAHLVFLPSAPAAVPEWLRAAAKATLPAYSNETDAVVLLNEAVAVVKDNGDIETTTRQAIRILRPDGKPHGVISIPFDDQNHLTYLKGWSIAANGDEYEIKEKDAVERAEYDGVTLYSDNRIKTISLPAVEVGTVAGFEYVMKTRPTINQVGWYLHDVIPVLRTRVTLRLPPGWEYSAAWLNLPDQQPAASSGQEWTWEFQNLPAIEPEPSMPAWQSLAGRMAITFFPVNQEASKKSQRTWREIGQWYASLAADRRRPTPPIQAKTKELTGAIPDTLGKARALAQFVQRDIRYVSIQIGIGGFQPHHAGEIFENLYGDCKDKATILSTMLREAGIESYYVVIHTERGIAAPQLPSLTFNHAILAIRLPKDVDSTNLYAVIEHPRLGRLLFFDPTDSNTPLGSLRSELQDTHCLLVTDEGGEMIHLPLLAPSLNRLLRSATIQLAPDGSLDGSVQELRWGDHASSWRYALANSLATDRAKILERFLGNYLGGVALQGAQVEGLEDPSKPLVVRYHFVARNFGKSVGNLLLVRPRVVGQHASGILEGKERKNPVEFHGSTLETDIFDITLPPGYQVDELPPPMTADCGFVNYQSNFKMEGNVLKYQRTMTVKDVLVPKDRLPELKTFYRQVAGDERNSAVLKRVAP